MTNPYDELVPIKTILLVEQDLDIGTILVQAIRDETSYQVIQACDGFQALKIVRSIVPHLFVLDDQLPSMDGIELYDHLHASPALSHVPAILMSTASGPREMRQRQLTTLKKPFQMEAFLHLVEQTLDRTYGRIETSRAL